MADYVPGFEQPDDNFIADLVYEVIPNFDYDPTEGIPPNYIQDLIDALASHPINLKFILYVDEDTVDPQSKYAVMINKQMPSVKIFKNRGYPDLESDRIDLLNTVKLLVRAYEKDHFQVVKEYVNQTIRLIEYYPYVKIPEPTIPESQLEGATERLLSVIDSKTVSLEKFSNTLSHLKDLGMHSIAELSTMMYGWQSNWDWSRAPYENLHRRFLCTDPNIQKMIGMSAHLLHEVVFDANYHRSFPMPLFKGDEDREQNYVYNFARHGSATYTIHIPIVNLSIEAEIVIAGKEDDFRDRISEGAKQIDLGFELDDMWHYSKKFHGDLYEKGRLHRRFETKLFLKRITKKDES